MATTFLKLYKEWMEVEQLPLMGLCNSLDSKPELKRFLVDNFEPSERECRTLEDENQSRWFWGSGVLATDERKYYHFTELRQTIILLCAALNGEFD